MDVQLVRWFNLVYAIILSSIVIYRILHKTYKVYRLVNILYFVALLYTISAYAYIFLAGIPFPTIISALGATVQLSAILAAITSQAEIK